MHKSFNELIPEKKDDKWTAMIYNKWTGDKPKVTLYHHKRDAFEKIPYNPHHIPH